MLSIRRAAAVLPTAALAVFALAGTAAAGNGPGTVTAVTHVQDHPDTTNASGSCTQSSPGGPVWAYDNLSLRVTATPTGTADTWNVTVTAHGSFAPICDPVTGDFWTGSNAQGSVSGWYDLAVTSATPPDPANVPARWDGGQGALVNQLFGGSATVHGGDYYYSYNPVDGGVYFQQYIGGVSATGLLPHGSH